MMLSAYLLPVLLLGSALAQSNDLFKQTQDLAQGTDLEGVLNKVGEAGSGADQNEQVEKAVKQGEEVFKKKCIENNAEDAYHRTVAARPVLEECVKRNVNMTEVQEDMAKQRKEGKLDEVFKKYCDRKGALQQCLKDFTAETEPCLQQKERDNLVIIHNITEQLANFVCFKDGDRIALFIAEKGPECLQSKDDEIKKCVSLHTNVQDPNVVGNVSVEDVMQFQIEFTPEKCTSAKDLQQCVVNSLTGCDQPTPSNIADALFKYVLKATPCEQLKQAAASTRSSSSALLGSVLSSLATAAAALALL